MRFSRVSFLTHGFGTTTIAILPVFLFIASLLSDTKAEEAIDKQPFPGGPAIARKAPDFACWSVGFAYPAQAGASGQTQPRPKNIDVTKTKDIYHIQKYFTGGSQRELWQTGKMFAVPQPAPRYFDLYEMDGTQEPEPETIALENFSITDFPEMSWASPANFVGIQHGSGGNDYLVYKVQRPPNIAGIDFGPSEITLYVDLRTRLPVSARSRDIAINYQFTAPPNTPLELPAELLNILKKRDKVIQMMTTSTPSF